MACAAVAHRERHRHVADTAELPGQVHFHLEVLGGLFLDVEDLRVAVTAR